MLMPAIARCVMKRRGRRASAERPVVADIGPYVPLEGPTRGQDRHSSVVAIQPLGGQHMAFNQRMKRLQRSRTGADQIGSVDRLMSMPSRR